MIMTGKQRNSRHLRNEFADTTAIAPDSQVHIPEYILELQVISLKESAFQQRPRDLESDEVVIAVGGVPALGNLHHVRPEFRANVRVVTVRGGDLLDALFSKIRGHDRVDAIDDGLSTYVRG